jgi:hypothetical protein
LAVPERLENWRPEIRTQGDLALVLQTALDFRGDVLFEKKSGERIEGFVFNLRGGGGATAWVELFPKSGGPKAMLAGEEILRVTFGSYDPAAGRSWETWVKRHQEKKRAQAEGREMGSIEPTPMPMDDPAG